MPREWALGKRCPHNCHLGQIGNTLNVLELGYDLQPCHDEAEGMEHSTTVGLAEVARCQTGEDTHVVYGNTQWP